ncbi:MAG: HIT domain-containing protein [Candidatus Binatia bacterium]|nr:HIT domain-containing protein [Deltaproteobacteria bacterium]
MKQIWAPWRMAYVDGVKEKECIFCTKMIGDDHRSSLVLAQTSHTTVMVNKYPYNSGHLLLAPKKHTNQLSSLLPEEYLDLCRALRGTVHILQKVLKPGGINVGMNLGRCAGAGVEDHLHWHAVPRWDGDTNFMAAVGETRVIPQHLMESYDRLSPFFKDFLIKEDVQAH